MISISGLAHAASGPQAAAQINPSERAFAPMAAGRTPATAATDHVKPEFPEHRKAGQRIRWNGPNGGHKSQRDWQVIVAALFG
jgi:hypothetical protein